MSTSEHELQLLSDLFGISGQDDEEVLAALQLKLSSVLEPRNQYEDEYEQGIRCKVLVEEIFDNLDRRNPGSMPEQYHEFCSRFGLPDHVDVREGYRKLARRRNFLGMSIALATICRGEGLHLIQACLYSSDWLLGLEDFTPDLLDELQLKALQISGLALDFNWTSA